MGIRLETNPPQNGTAKLLLIDQPDDTQVLSLYLHDATGRLIKNFSLEEIAAEPIATTSQQLLYMMGYIILALKTNKGDNEIISVLVRN